MSGVHAAISGKRDHAAGFMAPAAELLPAELLPAAAGQQRTLLNLDLSEKLANKVSGVHAAISGKRQAHDALMEPAMPPVPELL